jgi:hypothetical protein
VKLSRGFSSPVVILLRYSTGWISARLSRQNSTLVGEAAQGGDGDLPRAERTRRVKCVRNAQRLCDEASLSYMTLQPSDHLRRVPDHLAG